MNLKIGLALFLPLMTFNITSYAETACSVEAHAWNNGYIANVTLTNNGDSAISHWTVALHFNQEPIINNAWGIEFSTTGNTMEATNATWNGALNTGQSASFGFVGAHDGDFQTPVCYTNPHEGALVAYLKQGVLNHIDARSGSYSSSSSSSSSSNASSSSSAASSSSSTASSRDSAANDITNAQEEGVDEADIIESDGTHLFVVRAIIPNASTSSSSNSNSSTSSSSSGINTSFIKRDVSIRAYITDSDNASAEVVGSLEQPQEYDILRISGAYLRQTDEGNRLAVIGNASNNHAISGSYGSYGYYPYYQISNAVTIFIVDVDTPSDMQIVEKLRFDGALVSSRRIGNSLYVAMRYSPNLTRLGFNPNAVVSGTEEEDIERVNVSSLDELLPHMYDESGASVPLLSANDCATPEWPEEPNTYAGSLVVLTRINLDDTSQIDSVCLPASASDIYGSQNAIYAFGYGYSNGMRIYKFSIGENMAYRGSIRLQGSIPCDPAPYCFGEKDDVLRLLYSAQDTSTTTPYRLVLIKESELNDSSLEVIATLPNEARPDAIGKPGERIYSMRSFGDHAYIVTFAKVDPLYAIDLSDPLDPYIAGDIEATGFSEYLHPVGENLLIGVGKDAVYDEEREMTWYQGVKVELFDISEPTILRSLGSEIIGKRGSQTTVNTDPRAFTFRNDEYGMRFALPIRMHNRLPETGDASLLNQWYNWEHTGLYVYQIETNAQAEAELSRLGVLIAEQYNEDSNSSVGSITNDRGVLDAAAAYYLHRFEMHSALIENLEQP
mgnify:CR=1 FL=1